MIYNHLRPLPCDLGRIQTCNRLSRNQVFYSVELRGQYNCKYSFKRKQVFQSVKKIVFLNLSFVVSFELKSSSFKLNAK